MDLKHVAVPLMSPLLLLSPPLIILTLIDLLPVNLELQGGRQGTRSDPLVSLRMY